MTDEQLSDVVAGARAGDPRAWETRYRLAPEGKADTGRRQVFADALAELAGDPSEKIVVVLTAPGFRHDVTLALPELGRDRSVLTTVVIEPLTATAVDASARPPEGFGIQVALDPARARRRLYPAVDPATTTASRWPTDEHEAAATRARSLLAAYAGWDAALALPDPATLPVPGDAARAQRLIRYLAQPFVVAETFSSRPGQSTPVDELLSQVRAILDAP